MAMKSFTLLVLFFMGLNICLSQEIGMDTTFTIAIDKNPKGLGLLQQGLLIPKVHLKNLSKYEPFSGDTTTTMIVFNTNLEFTSGFYYWDGTRWEHLTSDHETWSKRGNKLTVPYNDFIGTTDDVPFRIRTNNEQVFDFSTDGRLLAFNIGSAKKPTYSWKGRQGLSMGMYRVDDHQLAFSTSSTERLKIDERGVIGIGTSTPRKSSIGRENVYLLNVTSDSTTQNSSLSEIVNKSQYGNALVIQNLSPQNNTTALEGLTSGRGWAIKGTHLSSSLSGVAIQGQTNSMNGIGLYGLNTQNGIALLSIGSAVSSNSWEILEDEMLVSNGELLDSALTQLLSLTPKYYTDKNEDTRIHVGFTASDVQNVFPGLVKEVSIPFSSIAANTLQKDSFRKVWSIDQSALVPYLTKAIQEQQAHIDTLEERITALELLLKK